MYTHSIALTFSALALTTALSACSVSYKLRSPEQYREDTRALLESKQSSFLSCYEDLLASSSETSGTVVIRFDVEEETGKFTNTHSLESSSASDELQQCVVNGMEGLVLAPPDDKTGEGTMTFEFSQG